jgi:hypothetical protein
MNRRTFLLLAAGVSVGSGLAALLVPAQVATVFSVQLNDVGLSQTRLLGAAYLGYAVIVWFAREVRDDIAQRAIALGNLVSWALSLVVTVAGIGTGLAGAQSWVLVVLEVGFAASWAYLAFVFVDQREVAAA